MNIDHIIISFKSAWDLVYNASINSKREHPPPRGNFLRWSKALPRGKIFLQKHGPRGKETPTPGEYFREIWSAFPVNRRRNFGILQKSNQEKNWKAVQVFFGHTL